MHRRTLLALSIVTALVLSACSDGGSPERREPDRAVPTIHTVPQLEPVARSLVEAYELTSGTEARVAVGPRPRVRQGVARGDAAIVPAPWLGHAGDAKSTAIGSNRAIIAVPPGNPAQVTGAAAFAADSGLETQICGPNSPFGNLAALVALKAGVQPDPARVAEGCETDAVGRVARGELAAALVFRGQLTLPRGVEVVDIPDDQNLVIGVSYAARAGTGSGEFEQFLSSDPATLVLAIQGLRP
jgi:hypothetical protein